MKRFDNWPTLLEAFRDSRRASPFQWGVNDCCLFACDAVLLMTGTDLAEGFRCRYTTPTQAARVIRGYGAQSVGDLANRIAIQHKLLPVEPTFAQRGDVVLLDRETGGETLGIVALNGLEVWAPGGLALAELPFDEAVRAWRIGI